MTQFGAFEKTLNESDYIAAQDKILTTLAIMLHHDATTGTHYKVAGRDYELRMKRALEVETGDELNNAFVPLKTAVARDGLDLTDLELCQVRSQEVDCYNGRKTALGSQDEHLITVYNPNMDSERHISLKMRREDLDFAMLVSVPGGYASDGGPTFAEAQTEVICWTRPEYGRTDECDVFVNSELPALTYTYFKLDYREKRHEQTVASTIVESGSY